MKPNLQNLNHALKEFDLPEVLFVKLPDQRAGVTSVLINELHHAPIFLKMQQFAVKSPYQQEISYFVFPEFNQKLWAKNS
jgi:hypothetical protein